MNFCVLQAATSVASFPIIRSPSTRFLSDRLPHTTSSREHSFAKNLLFSSVPSARFRHNWRGEASTGLVSENMEARTNKFWEDLRASFGQRINLKGFLINALVIARDRHLAVPHVSVPDISYIDWGELQRRKFRGVVLDKDNTITAPYSYDLWGSVKSSIDGCRSIFGESIAVFSNSVEYDPDGSKAEALERAIGIRVIRHKSKKPSGSAEEIEKHFNCSTSELVMIGDRIFTDIIYGNQNGFFTILSKPLTPGMEPFVVKQICIYKIRKLEDYLLKRWKEKGLGPSRHHLLPDAEKCSNDPFLSP